MTRMMIKRDLFFLLLVGLVGGLWLLFAGRDGYTGSNAMIVARSISVVAAIEGEVDGLPVKVGSNVAEGDLMVRIQNGRIDRSRLAGPGKPARVLPQRNRQRRG